MKNKKKENPFLSHYKKHQISPVRQDLSDIKKHYHRRLSLYRSLGLLPSSFEKKDILEVGAGGGYNPLIIESLNPHLYTIVEPNKVAVENLETVFLEQGASMRRIEVHCQLLENFRSEHKYDVVLCEGLIPGLQNKKIILKMLDNYVKTNGVLVITCCDEISIFFEIMRLFLAQKLICHIKDFNSKIGILVEAFGSHLESLANYSRLKEDWCADCLMGKAHFNYNFSIKNSIEYLEDRYLFYNSSPHILVDYRWYKDLPDSPDKYNALYKDQFDSIRHNLIHYKHWLPPRDIHKNNELYQICEKIMGLVKKEGNVEPELLENLALMKENLIEFKETEVYQAIDDLFQILKNRAYSIKEISEKYKYFREAFGRAQQYVSFIKVDSN